ncbi:SCO7613 C-terminal domain-containing membrane protein [Sphaerimonospora sp. CA-214678]|uniref:SCO7613 C-terminal domain-containing membrane protein n=1 Tax=Sphaerimonospora sp. CA-214678 TaxID=3240029 RepID=UPI003D8A23D9
MSPHGHPGCPDCGAPLTGRPTACPACALPLTGPVAAELWRVDTERAALSRREAQLTTRRGELLTMLRAVRAGAGAGATAGAGTEQAAGAPGALPPPAPDAAERPRDMSARAVQNLLLALGGILLAVAAVVFTAVNWGHLGIGGRAAILLGLTGLVLAAPLGLRKRGLHATAETLAMLGLALLLLDGYAAWHLGLADLDRVRPQHYTAGLVAVVAGVSAAYGRLTRLRCPVPVAVVLAQFPLVVAALDQGMVWLVTALIATACADAVLWLVKQRVSVAVCFGVTWSLGVAIGIVASLGTHEPHVAWRLSAALLVAVVAGPVLAMRANTPTRRPWPVLLSASSAITLIMALALPGRLVLEGRWAVVPGPVAALLVAALAVLALRTASAAAKASATAAAITAAIMSVLLATPVLPPVADALAGPLRHVGVWGGVGAASDAPWSAAGPPDLVVLAALALASVAAAPLLRRSLGSDPAGSAEGTSYGPHQVLAVIAMVFCAVTVAVFPVALDLPYPAAMTVQLAPAIVLALLSARIPLAGLPALAAALGGCAWALASEPATLITLPVLAVAAAVPAVAAGARAVRVGAAAAATLLVGGEAVALWIAAGLQPRFVTFVLLAVACAAGIVATPLRAAGPGTAVETAGYALGTIGLLLAADLRMFSLACAVAGVLGFGTALRPDRRMAGYAGTAFLLPAHWTRLLADGVEAVEAYTVPFSLVLLAIGWWRARRSSSWLAYGSGLSFSLLPSLLALYAQPEGWIRPAALGLASMAVLLAGARFRLQAPAVLGGFTLAAVAVHELAPWIAQLMTVVPRWVPVAVGGLALLLIGATYEARLRDIRRIRDGLRSLR